MNMLNRPRPRHQYTPKGTRNELIAAIAMIVIMIGISTQVHFKRAPRTPSAAEATLMDARIRKLMITSGAQVVPGTSAGRIALGDSEESVSELLGKPAQGDAAMCKSWTRWQWGEAPFVLEVFASCDPQKDMRKTVQQIRFSNLPLSTRSGVSPKSTFADIQKNFQDLEAQATFVSEQTGKRLIVLDQVEEGIAFIVDADGNVPAPQGKCHMIIIHQPGKRAIDTYLQPEWKLHPL